MTRFDKKITVLVVDDDAFVRNISTMLLQDLGFNVIEAEDGNTAIEILNGNNNVDVVFSDMMMPGGMNGIEMIMEMRKIIPALKAIIVSGYDEDQSVTKDMDITWVIKPFTREILIEKFTELLGDNN